MSKIYSDSHEEIHKLLGRASNESGATLLIPDLQRPYVWTPSQVVLLLDSLIRGWPFGTLLLWDVHQDDLSKIPSRPFWRMVDRTEEESGTRVTQLNPPANFQMVLDGQQRIQSLILALGGDSWGFKAPDKEWHAELGSRLPRSRSGSKHWSTGTLCVDLDALAGEFTPQRGITGVDFTKVLKWVVTDAANGRSKAPRAAKYEDPLPTSSSIENKGKYLRLSRVWDVAPPKEGLEHEQVEQLLHPILDEHGVSSARVSAVIRSLRSLTQAFSRIKLTRVNYLRVERFDSTMSEDAYNDSVVGIFTRLNTAGRTLSREEITFAWLKVGWTREKTNGLGATECYKKLLHELQQEGLANALVLDDLVAGASFAWAVRTRQGALLSDRDLLKKDIIHPMADDLSASWFVLEEAFVRTAATIKERKVEFQFHYQSLNALWILCTWSLLADEQLGVFQSAKVPERDAYTGRIRKALEQNLDRWFFCSSWASRWAKASGQVMAGYASRLAELHKRLKEESKSLQDAAAWLEMFIEDEIKDFVSEATADIERLGVETREQVRTYYSYLWMWHRLHEERWKMSSIPLRESQKKKVSLDVDHIVSVAAWKKIEPGIEVNSLGEDGATSAENEVHGIGNCFLLEKSFNVSKGDKALGDFIAEIKEFKTGAISHEEWSAALNISPAQSKPSNGDRATLVAAFAVREKQIKEDLIAFVKGEKSRCDI